MSDETPSAIQARQVEDAREWRREYNLARRRWYVSDVRNLVLVACPISGDRRPRTVPKHEPEDETEPTDAELFEAIRALELEDETEPTDAELFEAIRALHIVSIDRIGEVIEAVRSVYRAER